MMGIRQHLTGPALSLVALSSLMGCASQPKESGRTPPAPAEKTDTVGPTQWLKTTGAERCPASVVPLKRESIDNLQRAANTCSAQGNWKMTRQLAELLTQRQPTSPWGPYYESLAAEGLGQPAKAMWMVDLAIKRQNNHALFYYQKGRLAWQAGEYGLAIKQFEKSVDFQPDFAASLFFLGEIAAAENDWSRALAFLKRGIEKVPDHKPAWELLGKGLTLKKDYDALARHWAGAMAQFPRTLEFRLQMAELQENVLKNEAGALENYRRIRDMARERQLDAAAPADLDGRIRRLEQKQKAIAVAGDSGERGPAGQKKGVKK